MPWAHEQNNKQELRKLWCGLHTAMEQLKSLFTCFSPRSRSAVLDEESSSGAEGTGCTCLEKTFNLERQDMVGVPLSAAASMAMLGAYYYLQPLGDTLALSMGIEFTPLVTVGNMTLIILINPVYAAVVRRLPTEAVVGVMFRAVIVMLLIFAALFATIPSVKWLSFCFAVYVGTISLFTTTTLNARLASLHTKAEAKRVYGIIAAGSQCGQLLASSTAPFLFGLLGNLVVVVSAVLYECSVQLIGCRSKVGGAVAADAKAAAEKAEKKEEAANGGTNGATSGARSGGCKGAFNSAFGGCGDASTQLCVVLRFPSPVHTPTA